MPYPSRLCLPIDPETITTLETIAQRVLWLSTYMIHYANKVRPDPDGMKVGGHQASCASVVSLMTALFCRAPTTRSCSREAACLACPARYSVPARPFAAVYADYTARFWGLQAYPSRTKDPDGVTISTGSVGLGAAATILGR